MKTSTSLVAIVLFMGITYLTLNIAMRGRILEIVTLAIIANTVAKQLRVSFVLDITLSVKTGHKHCMKFGYEVPGMLLLQACLHTWITY
jgi:hypothetical protein